jgi:hypothetical protein
VLSLRRRKDLIPGREARGGFEPLFVVSGVFFDLKTYSTNLPRCCLLKPPAPYIRKARGTFLSCIIQEESRIKISLIKKQKEICIRLNTLFNKIQCP